MDRRQFIALGGSALLHGGAGAVSSAAAATQIPVARRVAEDSKPNILMIMADQLRKDCVGAYGNKAINTPNIDRLASEGVLFRDAYSSTPSCTPARSALLTGMSPWKHGMLGYSNIATNPYPVEKGKALAQAGYYTTSIGKNHYYPITNPHGYHHLISDEHCSYWFDRESPQEAQSYEARCDYESWFWSQLPDKNPHQSGLGWNDRSSKPFPFPEEMHATHWTGTTAVRFLQQYNRLEPFFLKVSFIRPHSPYDPPERFFKMYDPKQLPDAAVGSWAKKNEPRSSERDDLWRGKLTEEQIKESRQGYYGSISFMDEQVGRLREVLEERGMLDNTLIIFFSDHGDMLGDQNLWRKSYAYEQSSHIPMLMRPPKAMGIRPGQSIAGPVEIRDILPTFLDTAGVPIPENIDGQSLFKLVQEGSHNWREYLDLEHDICYAPTNHWNALTDGKWKYIFHAFDGQEQLFHLHEDPNELNDLAQSSEFSSQLVLWRGRMVDHLKERGEVWVQNGKLKIRKNSTLLSPNFPGYAPPEKISGWR